jgi:hypothetical protein
MHDSLFDFILRSEKLLPRHIFAPPSEHEIEYVRVDVTIESNVAELLTDPPPRIAMK